MVVPVLLLGFVVLCVPFANAQVCGVDFAFASYYLNHMVLQRAPVASKVWGYASAVADQVTVQIVVNGETRTYVTASAAGSAGRPIWSVSMDPVDAGGPYDVTAHSALLGCSVTITDVLFGDVWLCSGQSNMDYVLAAIDNPEYELADAVNYPDVRFFISELRYSATPLEDLAAVLYPWTVPNQLTVQGMSAVCWLFGKHLYDKYQVPIGLIRSSWGGTRIEAWSSAAALDVCFPDGTIDFPDQNADSVLYNAMIHPFLPMPIYGAIWYQGESNTYNPLDYGCAVRQMVEDWRNSWFANSPSMDSQFPFGEVQLAPWTQLDARREFAQLRWAQTYGFGYVPNDLLPRFFLGVAVDTADFDSPYGPIHPRYKRQVASRLALAACAVAYGDESSGLWQGPLPTAFSMEDSNLVITLADGAVELTVRDTTNTVHYEVCCSSNPAVFCAGEGDGVSTRWELTTFLSAADGQVRVSNPCTPTTEFVVGVRYAWRESPCPVLEECAIYSVENELPAPPFLYNGYIQ